MSANANAMLLEKSMVVIATTPSADYLTVGTTIDTDVVCLQNYRSATFIIVQGVSTGGTSDTLIKAYACDNTGKTNAREMAFHYWQDVQFDGSQDRYLAMATSVVATGASFTGANNEVFMVEVTADEVLAAGLADAAAGPHHADWVYLTLAEATGHPVDGCVICVLHDPRHTAEAQNMPYGN